MNESVKRSIRVATLAELERRGVIVVQGANRPIAVFAHDGLVAAVDNRCPHMGFPLQRGTVQDGILTCHWHHARFDLRSGCTFDLFADDAPAFDVEVRDGTVYVAAEPRQPATRERDYRRLREGLAQNIGLIQFKCLVGLRHANADYRDVAREIATFGLSNRDRWGPGLVMLTATANIFADLGEETGYLALCQAARAVAADCAGQPPRRPRYPLATAELSTDTLKRWVRYWTLVRHRDGAERTLLTAIANGAAPAELAELVFSAATDRFYADGGHLLDFCNKAFELIDLIGGEHAAAVIPAIVAQLVEARGGEESNAWRHPADLVPALNQVGGELPELLRAGVGKQWRDERSLRPALLGDDPLAIMEALRSAIRDGAQPAQLSSVLTAAAAERIARFSRSNELGDWITALHSFSYCHALHQTIKRCPTADVLRGVFHGAVSVYLNRFLNVPPAEWPDGQEPLPNEPAPPEQLRRRLLEALDGRDDTDVAARVVARFLRRGHPVAPLLDTLAMAVVREDLDFHTFQMLEASLRLYHEWQGTPEAELVLIALARYVSAFSPTRRDFLQRARIALRLHRGENLYEDQHESDGGPGHLGLGRRKGGGDG